jgi:LPS-assembly protein
LKDHSGTINKAEYIVGKEGAHGKSQLIKQHDKTHLTLKNATFTTCPAPVNSWHFASSEIKLNNKTQIGTAKNVTLNVGSTPVFYFPWLNFPINGQRLSGFLAPRVRLQSNAGVSIPYYFNLAPNYDATVTLNILQHRGLKLDSEFRYLTTEHKGKIEYDFMPQDKSFDSEGKNQHRDYYNIQHLTKVSKDTQIKLDAEGVSDKDYFDDFSTSLQDSTRSSLQRRVEITHKYNDWTGTAAIEDYQILDINDAPYSKLPELTLKYSPKTPPKAFKVGMDAELIYFDKSDSTTGTRANIKLHASKKWGNDAWYFKPALSLQYTLYSLRENNNNSMSRNLPTFTLDSGLFFDRQIKHKKYTQTLEPRLFYSFTPYKKQDDIPIFDTALSNFSATNQLFSENRFTGKDRIADTNQLTFAITSRIQDRKKGKELFKASIGQIFNFSDKKVTLPGGTIQTGKRSDLVLELSGRLNDNFRLSSTSLWSHEKKRIPSYELRLNYQDKKKRIANISYRKLDTELKQVTVSGSLPINDKWSFVGSIDHDIKNDRNLEALVGFEYQDCCWKTRLVAKRYLNSDNETYETPVFLEFELKGLGNIGTGASRELKDKIYGYDDY